MGFRKSGMPLVGSNIGLAGDTANLLGYIFHDVGFMVGYIRRDDS
jgi:hypothetical protein